MRPAWTVGSYLYAVGSVKFEGKRGGTTQRVAAELARWFFPGGLPVAVVRISALAISRTGAARSGIRACEAIADLRRYGVLGTVDPPAPSKALRYRLRPLDEWDLSTEQRAKIAAGVHWITGPHEPIAQLAWQLIMSTPVAWKVQVPDPTARCVAPWIGTLIDIKGEGEHHHLAIAVEEVVRDPSSLVPYTPEVFRETWWALYLRGRRRLQSGA